MKNFTKMFLATCMLIGFGFSLNAQSVGINGDGSAPDNSAMLDVRSTDKGLLIPQIALQTVNDITTIANPALSLLVYNTSSGAGLTPGYYYWSGAVWTKLTTAVADGSETKVTAGTNVTITGAGTTASPYMVNAIPSLTAVQRDALSPVEGQTIYNSTSKKPNFYNGTEWMNYDGTSATTIAVGISYQGGIIAYILQSVDPGYVSGVTHGLIVADAEQSTGAGWGCYGTEIYGADGTVFGTGAQNTQDIVNIVTGCIAAGIAARLCNDLELNGYSDWYLPSKDELDKLYINRVAIGGFADAYYWSSSEHSNSYAWFRDFGSVYQSYSSKNSAYYVRAVRAF